MEWNGTATDSDQRGSDLIFSKFSEIEIVRDFVV